MLDDVLSKTSLIGPSEKALRKDTQTTCQSSQKDLNKTAPQAIIYTYITTLENINDADIRTDRD